MSDITTHLLLPYILALQAQMHVTHNEAFRLPDAMVHLSVLDRKLTARPVSPADGDRHIVASGDTGLWAGRDWNVAFWVDDVWMRLVLRLEYWRGSLRNRHLSSGTGQPGVWSANRWTCRMPSSAW